MIQLYIIQTTTGCVMFYLFTYTIPTIALFILSTTSIIKNRIIVLL